MKALTVAFCIAILTNGCTEKEPNPDPIVPPPSKTADEEHSHDHPHASKGIVIQPSEGEKLIFRAPPVPDSITLIVGPRQGCDRYAVGTQNLPVDYLVPMHKHETEDEILFFHKGHSRASVGGDTVDVEPGTTVYIPHGTWHSVHNNSDEPAQMLWFVAKPGLEEFFREGSVSPGQPWSPLTPQEVDSIGKLHGVVFAPQESTP